jgi:predicted GNAT family acetyltransferase
MSIDGAAIGFERQGDYGRYSYRLPDGSEAEMTYVEDAPGAVIILHTYTPPRHRGQGIAEAVVTKAVEEFRAAGKKVVPACWFARQQFDAHPDWADLLAKP